MPELQPVIRIDNCSCHFHDPRPVYAPGPPVKNMRVVCGVNGGNGCGQECQEVYISMTPTRAEGSDNFYGGSTKSDSPNSLRSDPQFDTFRAKVQAMLKE